MSGKIEISTLHMIENIETRSIYNEAIQSLLKRVLPSEIANLENKEEVFSKTKIYFSEALPLLKWSEITPALNSFSIILLCRERQKAASFFYDLVTRWIVPGKMMSTDLFFTADFQMPEISSDTFLISEIVIPIKDVEEIAEIKRNIRTIETEVRLGVLSDYHANRIMEFKGCSIDRKTVMIQEKIGSLVHKRSKEFEQGILPHMQHFLVTCKEEFKTARDYHHISRIISILYLMRKMLKQKMAEASTKRHVILKFVKTNLFIQGKERSVLGILVGMNFLKEYEIFEKEHFMKAVQKLLPSASAVENSLFVDRNHKSALQTLYLEIEKEGGDFSFEEIQKLRGELPHHLKDHVEYRMPSVFMPRNEEEVVRNIMILSRQLQYIHDFPQVIISFDKQTASHLSFTIILLRVLKGKELSLHEVFKQSPSSLTFIPDRVKTVGNLRKKYFKEANVFHLLVPSSDYMREDHSVDLNKARADVLIQMTHVIGEIRDYNGGMIYKQNEAYRSLKSSLGQMGEENEFILEKFFYSITPVEMTVVFSSDMLKNLFLMLLNAIKREGDRENKPKLPDYLFKQEKKGVYIIMPFYDEEKKMQLMDKIDQLHFLSSQLVCSNYSTEEVSFVGYIFACEDETKQRNFLKIIHQALDF